MRVYLQLCSLLTDQLIRPTSNDLSLVVQWWFWTFVSHAMFLLTVFGLSTNTLHSRHSLLHSFLTKILSCVLPSTSYYILYAFFLLLSKWYTLRERNREINIQAIVEEHYERYMDQEEEYEREHGTNSFS